MQIYITYVTLGVFCDNLPIPVAMVTLHYKAARFEAFDYTAMIKTLGERQREGERRERCALFFREQKMILFSIHKYSLFGLRSALTLPEVEWGTRRNRRRMRYTAE